MNALCLVHTTTSKPTSANTLPNTQEFSSQHLHSVVNTSSFLVIRQWYGAGGAAEPAPRDPRGGGFDPGDAAAFAAASAPSLPGVPQGQSGFASRGG